MTLILGGTWVGHAAGRYILLQHGLCCVGTNARAEAVSCLEQLAISMPCRRASKPLGTSLGGTHGVLRAFQGMEGVEAECGGVEEDQFGFRPSSSEDGHASQDQKRSKEAKPLAMSTAAIHT